jgi:ADP-heptose:LPS heptosyltransferase
MPGLIRYSGEQLGENPHVVLLGSCKVGNFVVSAPVLQGLKARFPTAVIGFLGSEVTKDFELAHPHIDWRVSWDKPQEGAGLKLLSFIAEKILEFGPIALAINLDGFNPLTCSLVPWLEPTYVAGGSLSANLRSKLEWGTEIQQRFLADLDWDSIDFLNRYQGVFRSNYIAELFCQMAYVADYCDPTNIKLPMIHPGFSVPDILIHCTTARRAKLWLFDYWLEVLKFCDQSGLSVGLVGSPVPAQKETYNSGDGEDYLLSATKLIDLRGRTSLIQLAGACASAKAVISVDAGPLHIAAAVGCATFAVVGNDFNDVGASPIRLWLPRCSNVSRSYAAESCSACSENNFRNDECLVDGQPCMKSVQPSQIISWLKEKVTTL